MIPTSVSLSVTRAGCGKTAKRIGVWFGGFLGTEESLYYMGSASPTATGARSILPLPNHFGCE